MYISDVLLKPTILEATLLSKFGTHHFVFSKLIKIAVNFYWNLRCETESQGLAVYASGCMLIASSTWLAAIFPEGSEWSYLFTYLPGRCVCWYCNDGNKKILLLPHSSFKSVILDLSRFSCRWKEKLIVKKKKKKAFFRKTTLHKMSLQNLTSKHVTELQPYTENKLENMFLNKQKIIKKVVMTPIFFYFIRIHFLSQISFVSIFSFLHKSIFIALPQLVHLDIIYRSLKHRLLIQRKLQLLWQ